MYKIQKIEPSTYKGLVFNLEVETDNSYLTECLTVHNCKPSASKDVYFPRDAIEKQVPKEVIEDVAGLKIFKRFQQENRVSLGADVGGGVGLDSSTNVVIDLDCIPAQVIATYKNNEIKPDAFAHVTAKHGKKFGECYVAVEKNYGSTNDILKTVYSTAQLHKTQRGEGKIKYQTAIEYGWETNGLTKPRMLADLCKAVEDGLIELNDRDLIAEARSFTLGDLMDNEVDARLTTRHFDLLTACCIAWSVRSFVKVKPKENYYYNNSKQEIKNPAMGG